MASLPQVEPYRHEVLAGACGVEKLISLTNENFVMMMVVVINVA